ncbi:MAG: InlB B-repeat-containing protein [Bacteroidaceae bacterium]|nr:InlB B-repeat-containing protein [Bacteroidaceae bacterium]MBR4782308.1 InlB B-repeat-containing protein [Bacteroidaceae bacterium]
MKRIFSLIVLAIMPFVVWAADDVIKMGIVKGDGRQWTLTVELDNPSTIYSGFQMDFVLPSGVTLDAASLTSSLRTRNLTIKVGTATNGLPRIVGYASAKKNNITGNSGNLFSIKFNATSTFPEGTYDVVAKNVRLTTNAGAETVLNNAVASFTLEPQGSSYKLTYWNADTVYYTTNLMAGIPIPMIDEPAEREGYSFCGWGDVPSVMPSHNLDLYAGWCVNSYTLQFVVDDMVVHTEQVAYNNPLPAFVPGDLDGQKFVGWGELVDGQWSMVNDQWSMPARDVTLTAKYRYVCDVNGDGSVNSVDVVSVYNYIIIGEESGIIREYADTNGDGDVNSVDVITIYNFIIQGE